MPVLRVTALLALGAPQWAQTGSRPSSAARPTPGVKAQLSGPYRWVRVDKDQNGEAEALRLEGFVRLEAARGESVDVDLGGSLHAGSQFITSQPGDHYAALFGYVGSADSDGGSIRSSTTWGERR
jgi:hypothetical protein